MAEGKNVVKSGTKQKLNKITVAGKQEFTYFEPDEYYKMQFEEAEVKEGQFGQYALLKFKVLAGNLDDGKEAKGKPIYGFLNLPPKEGSDGIKMLEVMMGRTLKEGEDIDLTVYYGNRYKGLIREKKDKKTGDRKQSVVTIKKLVPKAPETKK